MTRCALVLIGPMGAGKTSVGRRVAKALGRRFYDSDIAVVREHGRMDTIFALSSGSPPAFSTKSCRHFCSI